MNKNRRIVIISLVITMSAISCGMRHKQADIKQRTLALALQGDVKQAIALLDSVPFRQTLPTLWRYRRAYHRRFLGNQAPRPPRGADRGAVGVLRIYQRYWRDALMKTAPDSALEARTLAELAAYLRQQHPPAAGLSEQQAQDTIDTLYLGYLESRGYHATGIGKTGALYDMLAWASEEERDYRIELPGGIQDVKVVFMDRFLTLGWEEFATFGVAYPGGWTKPNALYCVKAAYDTNSEDFRVSYLTHEVQHFADNARYPKLQQPDLEYRAKLAELCKAEKSKDKLIRWFIANALDDSTQAHSFADHCLVRDLSRKLFRREYVADAQQWRGVASSAINEAARELLRANSAALDQRKDPERYLK